MDVGKNKLRSIIKQVQNSADGVLPSSSSGSTSDRSKSCRSGTISAPESHSILGNTQLDLSSAIEYNYCLIDSYLQERNGRKLSPYEEILKNPDENEDDIIRSIGAEFFLDNKSCDINEKWLPEINNGNIPDDQEINDDIQSIIIEKCVLNKLPEFSQAAPNLGDEFLNYLENETKKLTKQHTMVSKRLTEMILKNDKHFKSELSRVRSIEESLAQAVGICSKGREALSHSKRDFTETSLHIVEDYRRREAIVQIIECLQNIKRLRQTVEHIEHMLKYEKNFSSAINLFNEKFEVMETMSSKYQCVAEMREKLVQTLQVVDDQMDSVLEKMTDRFCYETYLQLCKAYSQIGKSDQSIHQLLLHFTNAIHDKAFSIVLGYVKLFAGSTVESLTPLGPAVAFSTPIKTAKKGNEPVPTNPSQESDFKRKPFAELCQYLNPESFLQCLTDLCRALWDIMNNYYQVLSFYQKEDEKPNLSKNEIEFAVKKLTQGVLRVWSDVQHKIRTLVSSVRFVQSQPNTEQESGDPNKTFHDHQQDQLLFSFEEFIKILTVCEKMIEIGEQFCQLYHQNSADGKCQESSEAIAEFQRTLYRQTRAYFQSYHQVSMSELKIFLENEIWTRCPIETRDEFELISNLQEFAFLKNRLMKKKIKSSNWSRSRSIESPSRSSAASTFLLSPVAKSKSCLSDSYFTDNEDSGEKFTPFDGIITKTVTQTCDEHCEDEEETPMEEQGQGFTNLKDRSGEIEIITTNTTLNVLRLMGRYMNIMFLLRPISHDIVKALLELFDYYFYTIYHFFAVDGLNILWIGTAQNQMSDYSESSNSIAANHSSVSKQIKLLNQFSAFIRRINDNLILNDSNLQLDSSPNSSPSKHVANKTTKYPCPTLATYVCLNTKTNHFALGERIMAIQSLIFIARQFYHLCPFLLEFLRTEDLDESQSQPNDSLLQDNEDGFKLLQFHYDKMYQSVESLQYQCLYAVSTKLFPYESLVSQMVSTKWDLKEIPSIHSSYVNVFVQELHCFDPAYRKLLESYDLGFLIPETNTPIQLNPDDADMPLTRLFVLSRKMNLILWECILKISNRTFVEGFASVRKCTNEGRALMQLDYEQFLSHIEKLMLPYYKAVTPVPTNHDESLTNSYHVKAFKSFLATERLYVEEFVKAYYITEPIFIEWIRQKPDYTTKQIVGLINCIANDNKKLRSSLLAAIDTSSIENSNSASANSV